MKKSLCNLYHFIPILIIVIISFGCEKEKKNEPPVAGFVISPQTGNFETKFTFDASGCSDNDDPSTTLRVRWDWDSDGIFDTDFSTNKILEHQFADPDTINITLEVIDKEESGNAITKSLVVIGKIPEIATDTVSNITENSATCGGSITNDNGSLVTVRGVCWSLSSNPTLADYHSLDGSGIGYFVSNLSDLTANTQYYLRAYATNDVGTAYGEERTFTTRKIWSCGDPLIKNHIEGNISPVNKLVIYGTVTNIPGEPQKCWITQNLGSDHQAFAFDDATEASAGWYWQFNRKQGYLHDGINRIPHTSWIDQINENPGWEDANDPCKLELGAEWRVPTEIEWHNLILSGGWINVNDAWNSGLKIHAAGYLMSENGALIHRGINGTYWSNTLFDSSNGWLLLSTNDSISNIYDLKSHCLPLRCVR